MPAQKADTDAVIGRIVPGNDLLIADLHVHACERGDGRMGGKGKLLLTLTRPARRRVKIHLSPAQHLHTLIGRFVVADIGKGALQILGNTLHHLVAVTGAFAVFILHVVAVKGKKGHLIVRRFDMLKRGSAHRTQRRDGEYRARTAAPIRLIKSDPSQQAEKEPLWISRSIAALVLIFCNWLPFYRPYSFASQPFGCFAHIQLPQSAHLTQN